MNQLCVGSSIRTISVLVVHLLLTHVCRGQSWLIGSSQPVVAKVGDDVILPCHLEPAVDVATKTLEWTRSDLNPRFVLVWRAGQDFVNVKNPSYTGRTSLFADKLKHGNISLKLSNVKPADEGRYRCFIPDWNEESLTELVVGAAASPVISLSGIDRDSGPMVLQCESKGWYPEPEVLWLDGEGNLVSAGPTETVRGPDDLYTVSSRVTVDKRHGNRFTCRVQQNDINQTRETHIEVTDDFFNVQSGSSATTVGLGVSLAVCIILILSLVFILWKKKNIMSKRNQRDETDEGNRKKYSQDDKDEVECLTEGEREQKRISQAAAARSSSSVMPFVSKQRFHEEKQRRERLEQQLQEEEQKGEKTEDNLKKKLEDKNKQLDQLSGEKQKLEDKVKNLEKNLETKTTELRTNKESADKKWTETNEELKKTQDQLKTTTEKFNKAKTHLEQQLQDEKQRGKKTEDNLKKELEDKNKQLDQLSGEKQKLEDKVKNLEKNLETTTTELEKSKRQETSDPNVATQRSDTAREQQTSRDTRHQPSGHSDNTASRVPDQE